MFSAAVRQPKEAGLSQFNAPKPSSPWELFAFSSLSHHGEPCCDTARAWLKRNGASLHAVGRETPIG